MHGLEVLAPYPWFDMGVDRRLGSVTGTWNRDVRHVLCTRGRAGVHASMLTEGKVVWLRTTAGDQERSALRSALEDMTSVAGQQVGDHAALKIFHSASWDLGYIMYAP
eukprot:CAMPEP_0174382682 /NCGR_PEP_ID=MMETSP0811_2-20130205/124745_1 /TAXON_ID=73025 ORGANISM="Eutreptiella gymnastica-like, Strain CCMP1594" /NCGR_SAMPLE_ID=MMETSP0811_2 /ASSEMBLY_ACC=CAM_ASM_000667 /LENGTH=107 /DNA_ID=CAMNT_0015536045 /DNA_START=996 /DNA_END=1319 /DNA_ORIENTATION=+